MSDFAFGTILGLQIATMVVLAVPYCLQVAKYWEWSK